MNSKNNYITPILFLIYNRPDTTAKVLEVIKAVKPKYLYIAADGPREGNKEDIIKCEIVRKNVLENIDWDCEVKTLFREKNIGCGKSVSSAITWFFENVEEGIILEDDCIPSLSFFSYCANLLERYRNNNDIYVIGGNNFQDRKWGKASYYFSAYGHIWGWATWRRAWNKYDYELSNIKEEDFINVLKKYFYGKRERSHWLNIFKIMKNKLIDTWDYQWTFTQWYNKGINIVPNVNLVCNVGFNDYATHTKIWVKGVSNIKTNNLEEVIHPVNIKINKKADKFSFYIYGIFDQKKDSFRNGKYMLLKHKIKLFLYKIKLLQIMSPAKSKEFDLLLKNNKVELLKDEICKYKIGKYEINIPPNYTLPQNQKSFKLYDRFLPVLAKNISSDKIIIDVGANIGDTAIAIIQQCENPIICIEPSDIFFPYLESNLKLIAPNEFSRVKTIKKLVGTGLISGKLNHTVGTASIKVAENTDMVTHIELDKLIDDISNVLLLKVDTDGFDFDVIKSAEKILTNSEPILYWENEILEEFQYKGYNELYTLLQCKGYKYLYVFDNFGNLIAEEINYNTLKNINSYVYSMQKLNCTRTFYYADILASTEKNHFRVLNAIAEYKKEWIYK